MSRPQFTYICQPWGETIHATKDQLQSFGIGKGRLFPKEPGGPRRAMTVTDPRGYVAEVKDYVQGLYIVDITYPGREYRRRGQTPKLENLRAIESDWVDEYVGTAEALIAAGLARHDQFPGFPGRAKTRTTILADGTPATGATDWGARLKVGAKQITKVSRSTFRVAVRLSDDEIQRRQRAEAANRQAWEAQWLDAARPAPLHAVYREMQRLAMLPRAPHRSESPGAFTAALSGMAAVYLRALRGRCEDETYSMSTSARELFEKAAEQLEIAIETADIVPTNAPGPASGTLHNGFWLRTAEGA